MNLVISICCKILVVSGKQCGDNMWTEITRLKYGRTGQRYASDLSDAGWGL